MWFRPGIQWVGLITRVPLVPFLVTTVACSTKEFNLYLLLCSRERAAAAAYSFFTPGAGGGFRNNIFGASHNDDGLYCNHTFKKSAKEPIRAPGHQK